MILTSFVNYLKNDVPRHTNVFTDQLSISSISALSDVVTVVCSDPHNLTTGEYITLTGAKRPREVASITRDGTTATLTTVGQHNYTSNYMGKQYATVRGADQAAYNGTFLVTSATGAKVITYELPDDITLPVSPATGNITIDEDRNNVNGSYVITVVNPTTITFESPIAITGAIVGDPVVHVRHRITGYLKDLDTFMVNYRSFGGDNQFYQYDKPWLLVIPDGTRTSKNKNSRMDTSEVVQANEYIKLNQIHSATIMTIYNTSKEHAFNVSVHDKAVYDAASLFNSVLAYKPTAIAAGQVQTGFSITAHGPAVVTDNRFLYSMNLDYISYLNFSDTSLAFNQTYAINMFDFDLTKGDPTITAAGYIP
jgi:hypothetical protein